MAALPIAAAIASAALMYFLAARIFSNAGYAIVALGVFASTPLLWLQAQTAPGSLYPLPFVVAWLLALARFQSTRAAWWLVAAGVALGLGVYTSIAAAVMMPAYLLVTVAVLAYSQAASIPQLTAFVGAFGVTALPFAAGMALHPEVFRATIKAHRLYDADRFNILQGARERASWVGLTARSEVYWDYFNPAFLFLTGGVLLLPLVVLIPIGLYRAAAKESSPLARIVIAGFFAAPLAALLAAEPPTPGRILFVTPLAAIVSTYGVAEIAVWVSRKKGSAPRNR